MSAKLSKIRALMSERGFDSVLIEKQMNYSWLCGGRGFISLASENSCGQLLVTKDDVYLLSNNIEKNRLATEECPGIAIKSLDFLWYEEAKRPGILAEYGGKNMATDTTLAAEFFAWRTILDKDEIDTFKTHGPEIGRILEKVTLALKPGMTEFDYAGELSRAYWAQGYEPITLIIAFDERVMKHRHPMPTALPLKNHVLGVVCIRYKGLIFSTSRLVYFGKQLPDDLAAKAKAVVDIDGKMIAATRPGAKGSDIFALLAKGYADHGYPGEEKLHHQGGLTGYAARENRAMPHLHTEVMLNQAYAWNPTITGTKSEDTIIVEADKNTMVTHTGEWKYTECSGYLRPDIILL